MLVKYPLLLTTEFGVYNQCMKVKELHRWQVSTAEARDIQAALAARVSREGAVSPRYVAGLDIFVDRGRRRGAAAAVVLSFPGLELAEVEVVTGSISFPYVPGLLSFREAPLMLEACRRLETTPDVVLVDGQGIAHPRRIGLASHLGLLLDTPAIGCAKSRLLGQHDEPGLERGSYALLMDGGEVIGAALRTKAGVRPVYVSTGHKIDLESAISLALACCRGYRLPEPSRLAHLAAGGNLGKAKVALRGKLPV